MLYEPAVKWHYPEGLIARLESLLQENKKEELLVTCMRDVAGLNVVEIRLLHSSRTWQERVALAHTIPRECKADQEYDINPERFSKMTTPALLLTGSESPAGYATSIEQVHRALPNGRVVLLAGQGHAATMTAPELFAAEVVSFLSR